MSDRKLFRVLLYDHQIALLGGYVLVRTIAERMKLEDGGSSADTYNRWLDIKDAFLRAQEVPEDE